MADLPNALLADIAQIIDRFHTCTQIENMFIRLGAPGEPTGNKMTMGYEWVRRANGDPAILSRIDSEFIGVNAVSAESDAVQ